MKTKPVGHILYYNKYATYIFFFELQNIGLNSKEEKNKTIAMITFLILLNEALDWIVNNQISYCISE